MHIHLLLKVTQFLVHYANANGCNNAEKQSKNYDDIDWSKKKPTDRPVKVNIKGIK